LPPWQFAQVELLPLEGALNDLLGALKDLPNPSEDLKLRLSAEGWFEDLPLVTLELLKDLPSLGEDARESISFRLSKLFGLLTGLTDRSLLLSKVWLLFPLFVNLCSSDRPLALGRPKLLPSNPFPVVILAARSWLRWKIDSAPFLASGVLNPLLREASLILNASPVLLRVGSIVKAFLVLWSKKWLLTTHRR